MESDLADTWEMTANGLSLTLKLHPGVKFHDGQPMTAEDVVATLERLAAPPKGVAYSLLSFSKVMQKIQAVDSGTISVQLTQPSGILLPLLADSGSVIVPKSQLVANQGSLTKVPPVGTGAFKFKEHQPGVVVELVRNDGYWRKGFPYLDSIQTIIIKDRAASLAAFRSGRLDTTDTVFSTFAPTEVSSVKSSVAGVQLWPQPQRLLQHGVINNDKPPFSDVRVRKAMFIAVDRKAAIQVLAEGEGIPGRLFTVPGLGMADADLLKLPGYRQPKDADVADAKKLLADAGYAAGFSIEIVTRPVATGGQDHSVFLAGELAKIGIKATSRPVETAVMSDLVNRRVFDIQMLTPSQRIPDPFEISRFFSPGASGNQSGLKDDAYKAIWEELNATLDTAKRRQLAASIEEYTLTKAYPGILTAWDQRYIGAWPQVKGWVPKPTGFAVEFEDVWLAR